MVKEAVQGEEGWREDAGQPLVSHHAQGASMTPDAFSEQRMPDQPLELDLTRTALIVVDMVNEFFGRV